MVERHGEQPKFIYCKNMDSEIASMIALIKKQEVRLLFCQNRMLRCKADISKKLGFYLVNPENVRACISVKLFFQIVNKHLHTTGHMLTLVINQIIISG